MNESLTSDGQNFKVAIRVRPPLPREVAADKYFSNVVEVEANKNNVTLLAKNGAEHTEEGVDADHTFTFDRVYGPTTPQLEVYQNTARSAVMSVLEGYNASIIAYGQTGTGKTHTMEGFSASEEGRGIIPRAVSDIFSFIDSCQDANKRFLVRVSYLQIYKEVISDLLKPERSNLTIREDKKKGIFVEGLSEWVVRSVDEIYQLLNRGSELRATGATNMNEASSRSHAVFVVVVEQSDSSSASPEREEDSADQPQRKSVMMGKLNLVDLAGSERVRISGATGNRLEEVKHINQSLSALGNVIAALTESSRPHVPYRNSKLTRLLEDSLGG